MEQLSSTQKKLLASGREEFLQKGYAGASLRNIVKQAGFTLGAFYGYYPDKEALFTALVEPAASGLVRMFIQAQDAYFEIVDTEKAAGSRELSTEYLFVFIDYIYDNFDAFQLIVSCADGTQYENYVHDLVEIEVTRTEEYYSELRKLGKLEGTVSRDLQHMITSAYFAAVFETVKHNMPRKDAREYVSQLAVFFNSGWNGLIKIL